MDGLSAKNNKECYSSAAPQEDKTSNLINNGIKSEEYKLFHDNAGAVENEGKYKEPLIKNLEGIYKVKYVYVKDPVVLDFSEDD